MHPIRPRFIDQISHTNCGPPSEVRKVHDSLYNVRHTSPRSPVICVYFSRSTIYTKYQYVRVCVCVCVYVYGFVCVCMTKWVWYRRFTYFLDRDTHKPWTVHAYILEYKGSSQIWAKTSMMKEYRPLVFTRFQTFFKLFKLLLVFPNLFNVTMRVT